jgi:hypothetical protein
MGMLVTGHHVWGHVRAWQFFKNNTLKNIIESIFYVDLHFNLIKV